jgi:lipoprotein-releasing system permease protein
LYKLLLCWRYLLTRYLAMVCIISVMLGVATLIVVNSVMSGFSTKLRDRLHGTSSDVSVESVSYEGFADPDGHMAAIKKSSIGDKIESMTSIIEVFAMLQYRLPDGNWYTRPIKLVGVDPKGESTVGSFSTYLDRQKDSRSPSFTPDENALKHYRSLHPPLAPIRPIDIGDGVPPPAGLDDRPGIDDPPHGVILGWAIAHYREKNPETGLSEDRCAIHPGDEVTLLTASVSIPTNAGGQQVRPVKLECIVADYFKSEMSEYDGNYVYVPMDYLQELRGMNNYGEHRVTAIQIKLKDSRDSKQVVQALRSLFPDPHEYEIRTWEDKQGAILAAISIEKGILNLLLFMIIAVAGFGILAIFSMIVTEKTRDIGILKALGASNGGVMNIFLGYGFLLGLVGVALGTTLGILFTVHINEIEAFLTKLTGMEVFDRNVYYFDKIPTDIQPLSLVLVNVGAIGIAVLFSVLPALRAALLNPVRALRYE